MQKVIKWLRPGLRIKRWIAVIFLGVLFAVMASILLYSYLEGVDFGNESMFGSGNSKLLYAMIGFFLFGFCEITGIYRLMKSMWGLMEHRRGSSRKGLVEAAYERAVLAAGPKVVAIGGGTGLSCVLMGLKEYSRDITAVVAMADDGGSSGKLRQELGINPPGDIRKCLIALADEEPLMSELLDFRFQTNELGGHSFGNIFLTALARIRGDFGEAVREANHILNVRGQVLPSTLDRVLLVATHEDGTKTTGQALISQTQKRIVRLELRPQPEPCAGDIIRAIEAADLIVIGPGSLYTSILPNLLIPGICEALARSKAKKVLVCNIKSYEGETRGFSLADFMRAVDDHTVPFRTYDYILVNDGKESSEGAKMAKQRNAQTVRYDSAQFQNTNVRLIADDVINPAYPIRHDTAKLAKALTKILKEG